MRKALCISSAFAMLLFVSACKKDDPDPTPNGEDPVEEPTADFNIARNGLEVTFTYTGEGAEEFSWNFGDGSTSTESAPVHVYDLHGIYDVQLTVNNEGGSASDQGELVLDDFIPAEFLQLDPSAKDGVLYALNHQRTWMISGIPTRVSSGVVRAEFYDGSSYADVGDLTFNQETYQGTISQGSTGIYSWTEFPDERKGFKKAGGPAFNIQGGDGHGFFNGLLNPWPFPVIPLFTSSRSISRSSPYTVTLDAVVKDADSVIVILEGPFSTFTKHFSEGVSQAQFDQNETSTLTPVSEGTLTVMAYKRYEQTLGTKTYMVVNAVRSVMDISIE